MVPELEDLAHRFRSSRNVVVAKGCADRQVRFHFLKVRHIEPQTFAGKPAWGKARRAFSDETESGLAAIKMRTLAIDGSCHLNCCDTNKVRCRG